MGAFKLLYQGKDIYPDIAVARCWVDGHAWGRLDRLTVDFGDVRNLWDTWHPVEGDEIAVEDGAARSGKMIVDSVVPMSSRYTVTAHPAPLEARQVRRCKSWERVKLSQLLSEVASRYGWTVERYGVEDHEYAYVEQDNETDLQFIDRRLTYEGASLVIYDGKLVAWSGQWLESQEPTGEIAVRPGVDYTFRDERVRAYGSCTVTDGKTSATYEAGEGRRLLKVVREHMSSIGEAERFARGILRNANRESVTMTIRTDSMLREYAAGSLVTLYAQSAASWDGPALVSSIRHDYWDNKCKIWLTKPLGY